LIVITRHFSRRRSKLQISFLKPTSQWLAASGESGGQWASGGQ
jgi:hypothetical protein